MFDLQCYETKRATNSLLAMLDASCKHCACGVGNDGALHLGRFRVRVESLAPLARVPAQVSEGFAPLAKKLVQVSMHCFPLPKSLAPLAKAPAQVAGGFAPLAKKLVQVSVRRFPTC